jgi:hypothetical protein
MAAPTPLRILRNLAGYVPGPITPPVTTPTVSSLSVTVS